MAFQSRGMSTAEKIHVPEMIDKPMIGYYMGTDKLEVPFPHHVHHFIQKDGTKRDIMGFTNLTNNILDPDSELPINILCRITYKGTKNVKTQFGMKDVHQVEIETDPDDFLRTGVDIASLGESTPNDDTEKKPF